jgi:nanoRNase/pAp phosphatase (c-di-AMP/oligoRNAs hydrolase)
MAFESRKRFRTSSYRTATSLLDESGLPSRPAKGPATAVAALLLAGSLATSGIAGDTDRFANCIASADMASAAAKSRDAGIPSEKTIAIIARQAPEDSVQQVKRTVTFVYSNDKLTPDEASDRIIQNCFELE